MKKDNSVAEDDDLRPEYDASELKGGIRGKYLVRYRSRTNLALLAPDVRAAFPTDEAVNQCTSVAHADPAPGLSPSDTLWARRLDFGEHDRTLQVERPSRWMKAARGVDSLTTFSGRRHHGFKHCSRTDRGCSHDDRSRSYILPVSKVMSFIPTRSKTRMSS